ncbi:MAG: Ig-like domain-containing protein, partial [Candidatus Peregrinibacteria bacterium]
VTDTLPVDVTFVSASDSGTQASGVVTWTVPSIAAGAVKVLTVQATVKTTAADDTVLTNTATVAGVTTTDTTTVEIIPTGADLSITKTGPTVTQIGASIAYTVTVSNSGPATAQSISITDPVPAGLTYNSVLSSSACTLLGGNITCALAPLPSGQTAPAITLTFTVNANATCGGTIQNSVAVTSANDPNTGNNSAQASAAIQCVNPTFSITKTDGKTTASPGEILTYTLTVTNTSTIYATNVLITDTLPALTSFVSASDSGLHTNGIVSWTVPTIAPSTSKILTVQTQISGTAANNTVLTNTGTVAGVKGTDTTTVVTATPTFTLTKTDGKTTASPGEILTYSLTVTNTSAVNATNVIVTDTLPPQSLTYVLNSASDGGAFGSGRITWTNLSINASSAKTLTLQAQVTMDAPNGFILTNTGTVAGVKGTDTTTVQSSQQQADLSITKTGAVTVQPGGVIVYTLTVTNNGPAAATTPVVADVLPAGLTFNQSQSTAGCVQNGAGTSVLCNNFTLAAGQSKVLTIAMNVPSTALCNATIQNTATISSIADPNAANNTSQTVQTTVQCGNPVFTISKTDNRTTVQPGESLTYTITVNNTSAINATNVTVTDTLPPTVTLLSASGATVSGQVITWTGLSIPAQTYKALTVQAKVNSATVDGVVLTNIANVGTVTTQDQTTVKTATGTNVTVTLSDSQDPVEPCGYFTYSVRVTNLNTIAATGVQATLSLDPQVIFQSASNNGTYAGSVVTWSNLTVPASSYTTVTAYVRASCSADDGDSLRSIAYAPNASDEELTGVRDDTSDGNALTLNITDSPDPVLQGDILTYSIRVCNEETSDQDITVNAYLDDYTSYLSSSGDGEDISDSLIRWNDISLDGDECETLSLRVRVLSDVEEGNTLSLRVRAEDEEDTELTRVGDCIGTDCSDDYYNTEEPTTISVDKQADRREAQPGSIVAYTVTIRNQSNGSAQNIDVEDSFTAGTLTVEDAAGGNVNGNTIRWNIPLLGPNATRIITYRVRISPSMRHGQTIANTVTVRSSDIAGSPSDTEQISVIENMPQTGIGGFIAAVTEAAKSVRPHQKTGAAAANDSSLPLIIWTNIIAIGIGSGWLFGKRILF